MRFRVTERADLVTWAVIAVATSRDSDVFPAVLALGDALGAR